MAHLINRSIAAQSAQSCNLLRQVTPRFIARNLRNVLKAIALFQQWQHVWRTGEGEGKRRRGWRREDARWQGAALNPGATMLADTRGDAPEAISFNLLAVQPI